jgi:hypothetical protein
LSLLYINMIFRRIHFTTLFSPVTIVNYMKNFRKLTKVHYFKLVIIALILLPSVYLNVLKAQNTNDVLNLDLNLTMNLKDSISEANTCKERTAQFHARAGTCNQDISYFPIKYNYMQNTMCTIQTNP